MLKKVIKSFLARIGKIILFIIREIYLYVPIMVLFIVALQYTVFLVNNKFSYEQYKILIGAIGTTATLSGLSFRAGSSIDDQKRKKIYKDQGLRLFHATILFILAIALNYIYYEMMPFRIFSSVGMVNYYANEIFKIFHLVFGIMFFYIGISYIALALMAIHTLLFYENLLP